MKRHTFLSIAFAFLLALTSPRAFGQNESHPRVQAYRIDSEISVDGSLDEDAWADADVATGFRQFEPNEGEPASQDTEVRILYGPEAIYVGAMMHAENPSQIMATLGRRDEYNRADWITVSFDSNNNQETAYTFAVNAAGIQLDGLRSGSGGFGPPVDVSWDAVWASDAAVTSEGWVAEMRIPYSMLRFSEGASQWRVQFRRQIPRRGEESEWPMVSRSERENILSQYGWITNLEGVKAERNVQARPYVMSRVLTHESSEQPGTGVRSMAADLGGDLKIGLTSNITLDATVNPDFGQVESDPAQLNLTAFETFFEERRPFFLEGTEIYEFGLDRRSDLLYTRRIGGSAPIVGATKLSGRTPGGTAFGFLGAATGTEFDPSRYYGVARLRQQIGAYSSAGAILTGFDGPSRFEPQKRTLAGGTDWDFRFGDNTYGLDGFLSFTNERWSTEGPADQAGWAGSLGAEKRSGTWRYGLDATVFNPEFDPNDLGRMRRNNYINVGGNLQHDINGGQAFGAFQRAGFFSFFNQRWSYDDHINQGGGGGLRSRWTTRGFQSIGLGLDLENVLGDAYSLFETRGLGPALQPRELGFEVEVGTDSRRNWELESEVGLMSLSTGGTEYEAGLEAEWTVGTRVSMEMGFDAAWERDVIDWSSNDSFRPTEDGEWAISTERGAPDELAPEDYQPFATNGRLDAIFAELEPYPGTGAYYRPVYGARDTREFDLTLRGNVNFMQNLSLELYSQVFLARGKYEDFRILKDRDTYARFEGYPKRDEFTLHSFQLNSVLRWEYRPGSTLFLVWTQSRRANRDLNPLANPIRSLYNTPLSEQLGDTFGLFPTNTFLVKIEYTFLR